MSLVDPQIAPTEALKIDADAAVAFLAGLYPRGPWCVAALDAERGGAPMVETFGPEREPELRAWLLRNQSRNLYYHVNRVARPMRKKASVADIAAVHFLHVDLDPRAGEDLAAERRRLLSALESPREGVPAPTYIVDSGGGFQALWRLERALEVGGDPAAAEEAKRYNQALELTFGADSCHNIDRLLRLPGTVNWPDAKKRAKGRVPAAARLFRADESALPVSKFRKAPVHDSGGGRPPASGSSGGTLHPVALDRLPDGVPGWALVLIVQGQDPDEPGRYPSRSEALFAACCALARAEVDDATACGVIMNPDHAISASVLEKGSGALRYAARQVERARELVADDYDTADGTPGGRRLPTWKNVRKAMTRLGVRARYNEFSGLNHIDGLEGFGTVLDDAAIRALRGLVAERERVKPSKEEFSEAVLEAARRDAFHPVRDYLDALRWDGAPRLDRLFIEYAGAADTDYTRAVTRAQMVAAVRRVRQPGTKHDEILVLEGPQGCGKSSALAVLAASPAWFTDHLPLNATKPREIMEAIEGHWIVECAELAGLHGSKLEQLKALLSRPVDKDRRAFGRLVSVVPRQCVFFGTTNSRAYLRDSTGNRRFWPVAVQAFDLAALARDRDQIWAEAAALEAAGEDTRLDPALYAAAFDEQDRRRLRDPWAETLEAEFGEVVGGVSSKEVWLILGVPLERREQSQNDRMGRAMAELGFERKKRRFTAGQPPEWGYERGASAAERLQRIVVTVEHRSGLARVAGPEGGARRGE